MSEAKYQSLNDEIIKRYTKESVTQIAKDLGVSRGTIQRRAKSLGLSKFNYYQRKTFEIEVCINHLLPNCFITSFGRVVNKETNIVLSPKLKEGYWVVSVQYQNKIKYQRMHRLIGYAFMPNPENLPVINHLDGNKSNNSLNNLEWVTVGENNTHAAKFNLSPKGEKSGRAVLTESQAIEIIELINSGLSTQEIVRKKSFATYAIVSKIKNKTRWKHLSHLMNWQF